MAGASEELRLLRPTDSLQELTDLLHRAYATLAARGLRYRATDQDVATTGRRMATGECYVMLDDARIVATIVLIPPSQRGWCAYYDQPGVALFSQFAVEPERQGRGLGGRLLDFVEKRAPALGATELACDTAEPSTHLIAFYSKRGYRRVAEAQWAHTNYRSVILSKTL